MLRSAAVSACRIGTQQMERPICKDLCLLCARVIGADTDRRVPKRVRIVRLIGIRLIFTVSLIPLLSTQQALEQGSAVAHYSPTLSPAQLNSQAGQSSLSFSCFQLSAGCV